MRLVIAIAVLLSFAAAAAWAQDQGQISPECLSTLNPFEAFEPGSHGFERFARNCYLPRFAPAPRQCGGDPFLVELGDGFKQCGEGMRQMLTRVPLLLLTGNFVEAARVLGVRPGESLVLRQLMQELGERAVGASPYQAGLRIGRRICAYGLAVGAGENAPRGGGRAPRDLPGNPSMLPEEPAPSASGPVAEQPIAPRKPSPTSFKGAQPDFQKQYTIANPGTWTAEEVGEAAMMAAAKEKGYWPLLPPEGASCTPQGSDATFWDPETGAIVVGEAKGGYNGKALDDILGSAYGARQGTIAWAEKSAQRTTRATRTNDLEVRYAEQIFRTAIRDRKVPIRVEVFHTDVIGGQAGTTRHYITDSLP